MIRQLKADGGKRNKYQTFDIVLPEDTAKMIDEKYGKIKKVDTYRVLAYLIFRNSLDNKRHELSGKFIHRMIPTYHKYKDKMVNDGVIDTDNHYVCSKSAGRKRKGKGKLASKSIAYRLNSAYAAFKIITVSYPKEIDAPDEKENFTSGCEEDKWAMETARRRLEPFQVDAAKAAEYLCARQRGEIKGKEPLKDVKALVALVGTMRIRNGFRYVKTCNYGRVHTNFTCLDSRIKMNCVYHESGERLVHIDIRNSQPSILGAVMSQRLDLSRPEIKRELDLFVKFCASDLYEGMYLMKSLIDQIIVFHNEKPTEQFKESLKKEMANKTYRKDSKSESIKMLFDKGTTGLKYDKDTEEKKGQKNKNFYLYKIFKLLFPHIYVEIKAMKKGNYAHLAHELQRFESRRILHPLIKYLDENDIDFISIHDSVIVKEKFRDMVITKFNEILKENDVRTVLVTENLKYTEIQDESENRISA